MLFFTFKNQVWTGINVHKNINTYERQGWKKISKQSKKAPNILTYMNELKLFFFW